VISRSVVIGRTAIAKCVPPRRGDRYHLANTGETRRHCARAQAVCADRPQHTAIGAVSGLGTCPYGFAPPRPTLSLLCEEYRGHHFDGCGQRRFCDLCRTRHGIAATVARLVRHHVDVLSLLGGRPKALVCDSSLNSQLTSSIPAKRNSASGRKTFGISRDPFPKSIDHIDGGRAAQQSCANLDDRVDLFAHHEIGFVLCVDTATRKLCDT
jgi:hypothetical protein